ncbi:molybdopterin-binding protein [Streptomyces sp. WAC06614]|uniref:TOBE domain-containing protein n=1 Tax=Streptomyces sp. WAC06614 TaxID=2487416 RepID=UPI000F773AE6|nr:TOBE domain-containing protein [Streptomyces sp. WAC06614]RSS79140.1 adenylate kinase [Streptomyces sp. WAC06614]
MTLSIRNQFDGSVLALSVGEAMTTVTVRLDSGQDIVAAVTSEAVEDLGLFAGSSVRALVKATEVALATGPVEGISIRNQIAGTVTATTVGGAMAAVTMDVEGGTLTAVVTKEAAEALGLTVGSPAVALIKSTGISLATS